MTHLSHIGTLTEALDDGQENRGRPSNSRQFLETRILQLSESLAAARHEGRVQLAEKERLAKRLERLLHVLPGGVVVLDGDGVVQEYNPVAQALLGESLCKASWRAVVSRMIAPQPDDGHEVSLRNGRRVNIATCSLGDEPGQILLIKDVTETRALQEQMARLQRLSEIGRMVAALAHQIRTPLASALLYLSGLRAQRLDSAERLRILDKVAERLRHLERLVGDMLAFARQGTFELEEIRIDDLVVRLSRALEPQLKANSSALELRIEEAAIRVQGNSEALHSAFQNLIENALQAGGADTRVRIVVRRAARRMVCIEFADDGPGIAPEFQARVLEPFFTMRPGGTGLGLAVVHGIISAHRGELKLSSVLGEGTTVQVLLPAFGDEPAAARPLESASVAPCQPQGASGKR